MFILRLDFFEYLSKQVNGRVGRYDDGIMDLGRKQKSIFEVYLEFQKRVWEFGAPEIKSKMGSGVREQRINCH